MIASIVAILSAVCLCNFKYYIIYRHFFKEIFLQMKKHILLATALLWSAAISFGAGFQINVQGLRQIAMGGTGSAYPWDASTIFYNPAGLSGLKGIQAYGSLQFLIVNTQYVQTPTEGYSARAKQAVYTPFNFYVGGPIKKDSKWGIGLGIYTPFGSGLTWDDDWEGRYIIRHISLQSFFFQPTASYKINNMVSVGAGFIYATGNMDIKRAIPLQNEQGHDGEGELKGNANGIGFNLGAQLKANDWLQFGINYRSKVKMKVRNGQASFIVPSSLKSNLPDTKFTTDLQLPDVLTASVAIKPLKRLTLTAEINYVGWKSYDTLRFDYETNTSALQDSKAPRNYKNTLALRLGAHYQATNRLAVMAGCAYDPSPVADGFVSPDLPDADRWAVTGGLSFNATKKLTILTAIEYGASRKRTAEYTPDNFNGKYQTKAIIPCIGVTYDF